MYKCTIYVKSGNNNKTGDATKCGRMEKLCVRGCRLIGVGNINRLNGAAVVVLILYSLSLPPPLVMEVNRRRLVHFLMAYLKEFLKVNQKLLFLQNSSLNVYFNITHMHVCEKKMEINKWRGLNIV